MSSPLALDRESQVICHASRRVKRLYGVSWSVYIAAYRREPLSVVPRGENHSGSNDVMIHYSSDALQYLPELQFLLPRAVIKAPVQTIHRLELPLQGTWQTRPIAR